MIESVAMEVTNLGKAHWSFAKLTRHETRWQPK